MLVKFEQNRMVKTTRSLSFLTEKKSVDAILGDVSVPETDV